MRIYATYNIKGGVGKTTTAVNLAYLAAESGLRTVLWDLEPQGAARLCPGRQARPHALQAARAAGRRLRRGLPRLPAVRLAGLGERAARGRRDRCSVDTD